MIDFSEIGTAHRWEQFAELFFTSRNALIIKGATVGQDGGADLVIEESFVLDNNLVKKRALVSCKYYISKSIGVGIEQDILDRIRAHNCDCFYGFYSTSYTTKLQEKLNGLLADSNDLLRDYHIFDDFEIESFLKNNLDNGLFKNNFEKSYYQFIGNSQLKIEKNTNFQKLSSEAIRDKKDPDYLSYYTGGAPQWEIIKKYTFKRDLFEPVILNIEKNKQALITSAGGEGKTTFLMQLGCYFFEKKYEVYYSFDGIKNINPSSLQFDKAKNYLLIIDQVNYLENLVEFLQKMKLKSNVRLLLAARKNEWLQTLESSKQFKDIQILIGNDEFSLLKLSKKEITNLDILLKKHAAYNDKNTEIRSLEKMISEEPQNTFLLATMIHATKGKKFEFYIADVLHNISKWDGGYETIKAIGYIVACEVLGRGQRGPIYCPEKLLLTLMDLKHEVFYKIKKNLAAEAFFQQTANRLIHTRNPIIARLYFDILFTKEPNNLSLVDFYSAIIHDSSLIGDKLYNDIIATIPIFLRKTGNTVLAKQMLELCITYGYFFRQFIVFIKDEVDAENIGNYEHYSARWLCKIACEKNPTFSDFYVVWARIENRYGELGNFESENTVRWIFKKGFDRSAYEKAFFISWAQIEIDANNIGDPECEQEFSARWLLRERFLNGFYSQVALVWAQLEISKSNFGDANYEPEYSARWIFKKCLENNNINKIDGDFYLMWARLEIQLNNIGKLDFKTPYSARWLLRKAFDKPVNCGANLHWAKLEVREDNLGRIDLGTPYSARWILKKTLERDLNNTLKKELLIYWAKLEAFNNNYGNYLQPYSALNLLKQLYDQKLMPSAGYIIWSAIQFYLKVTETDPFSFTRLFEKAKEEKKKIFFHEKTFDQVLDWEMYLQNSNPQAVFKPTGFHYLTLD